MGGGGGGGVGGEENLFDSFDNNPTVFYTPSTSLNPSTMSVLHIGKK